MALKQNIQALKNNPIRGTIEWTWIFHNLAPYSTLWSEVHKDQQTGKHQKPLNFMNTPAVQHIHNYRKGEFIIYNKSKYRQRKILNSSIIDP